MQLMEVTLAKNSWVTILKQKKKKKNLMEQLFWTHFIFDTCENQQINT